jgi:hypothetical protein
MFNTIVMNNLTDNKNGDFHQNTVILSTNSPLPLKKEASPIFSGVGKHLRHFVELTKCLQPIL